MDLWFDGFEKLLAIGNYTLVKEPLGDDSTLYFWIYNKKSISPSVRQEFWIVKLNWTEFDLKTYVFHHNMILTNEENGEHGCLSTKNEEKLGVQQSHSI